MADLDVAVRLKFLTDGEGKLKAAAKSLADFSKSASRLSGRATGRFGGDLNKAWHASVKLGGALDKSAKSAGKTATGLRAIGTGASGIDRTRAAVDRLAKSTNALGAADRKVRLGAAASDGGSVLAAGALGGAMAKRKAALKEGFAEAASHVSPGAGYLVGAGGAVAVGAAVGATAAAGLAVAARSTKEAIDRNKAMAEVQKKVNLDVGDSWEAMERRIAGVSRKIGISYTEAASAFAQGGQGNVAAKDLEDFALLGAKISAAWDVGAKEAAQTLTEVKAQTRWTIAELQEFGDKVNFLGDISAGAERDIASMFSRTASAAKAAGVGFDESLVAMTALRSVGMEDSVASRFFGQFTAKLRTATHQSKDAQAAFKDLGLSAKAIEKGMQTKPMETMMDFLDRLAKSKDPVRNAMAFGGQQWFDEMLKFKEAAPELIRLWKAFKKGGFKGSLDQALEKDLNTTTAKLKQAWQGFLDVGAEQFKGTLPLIDAAADKLRNLYENYLKASDSKRILDKIGKEALSPDDVKRVANDPDLLAKIEAQERARNGTGESLAAYERRLRLDRPVRAPAPMISQIEGATPHIDAQQINQAAAESVAKTNDLYDALQKLNVTVRPNVDGAGAIAQMEALKQKAQETASAMRALQNFGAPTSGTRVNPTLTGAPRGGGGSTGGGSAPATPGKQSRLGRGGPIQIGTAHFHGVKDAGAMRRQLAAFDRRIRSARDNALHDIG
ncbi:MAG: phage tail tape measure protein [Methylocystis sp.]|nr:MAG: phage tail tape measure protein [Methylocystis sp.]